jgi:hypothetical protein
MAQRMRDYRAEIGDKRRKNFALFQQKSQETIMRAEKLTVSGLENVDSDETKEDLEMNFFFKSSDLLRTFKHDSV